MIVVITLLALMILQIVGCKLVWDSLGWKTPRGLDWLLVLLCYGTIHLLTLGDAAFLRMVLLCSVLLGGMKWMVYAEWRRSGGKVLSWSRWLCFGFLWFGMDPNSWTSKRRDIRWKHDLLWGLGCLLVGVFAVWMMAVYQVDALVPLFIAMSVGFHYGALRLLTTFWKFAGIPVKPLFRNPLAMSGFNDFWSRRWNLAYSHMMARVVKRPLVPVLGEKWALFAVFAVSGLLHELAITVPVGAGYGLPTLFFLIHGMAACLERKNSGAMALLCGVLLIAGLPLLFPGEFVREVIWPSRDVFLKLPNDTM
ncbi:Membrane bound O-acyl transferase family protein [Rubritalea squalenifaciens DSM 18772]|uniref:Membrane bound O-acyl transferase family protein n=1 Tax=Rubritalea squalenifaciens DSM 18772 TaxID=1123071 RepID=A0A1M6J7Q8_9BACT|nr:membrane bound O-acyl transferase family-domain-containing protein [Rubritalea squalenifaciens]SHJ42667.1 Membrane bound O-acyl transferase family protein [Rubritalea squalenifaciens DSM 18772]